MPLVDWNLKATWDAMYSIGAEGLDGHPNTRPEVRLHYHRSAMGGIISRRAAELGIKLGPAQFNKRVLIVGGGFGWLADEMRNEGFNNLLVTDTSAYVQAEKDNTDEVEIRAQITAAGLDPDAGRGAALLARHQRAGARRGTEDVLDADICLAAGRSDVTAILGNPQIVITEQVLESLSNAEAITFSGCCSAFAGPQDVYHLVETLHSTNPGAQDPTFNLKSLADWKLLIPVDRFIDVRTFEILL